jgi:hypothetical protein
VDDHDLYDQAADRYPTVLRVDPEALDRADRLFGPDPELLLGYWADIYFKADDSEGH